MELIQIGLNGPKVPAVGVGCWPWGDTFSWGYGVSYGKEDTRGAFKASVSAGLTFFDTAEIYGFGRSESLLGEFIAGSDAEVLVASKCFPYPWRLSSRSLKGAIQRSLKRLGIPQIHLYQMHWPTPLVRIEDWMNAMADAVEAGLIRQVGVSNYNQKQTEIAYRTLERRGLHLASNQIKFSLLARRAEHQGLLQLCKDLGVTVIAYSPIAQGLLTGKYSPQNPPPPPRRVSKRSMLRIQPLLDELRRIGIAHANRTPVQVALNWCIAKGTLPIPSAKNERQAQENAGALGWSLTEADIARLDEISDRIKETAR
jgi:aryl-alcohol dehydrogenase-like predicted oxidoreductase